MRKARRQLIHFVTKELKQNPSGLKLLPALTLFCRHFKLETPPKNLANEWLIEVYLSGINPIINQKAVSPLPLKDRKKEINLDNLAKKAKGLPYPIFLKSKYWAAVRTIILNRDNKSCKSCGSKFQLHVHHKTYNNHFNEHNHLADMVTLCHLCHKKEHSK
jgi:hypothetical protein